MADIKVVRIESLPATTAVTEDDYLVVQQPDLTRRVKIGDVVHVDGTVSHVISFKEGGKLNGPMDFAYFEEEDLYLRWKGEFPHTVPALSSPYSDGGITDAAWMVYTDPSLREELESTIGASMIMTAEGQSVQDVMDVTVQTANDAKALAQRVDFGTVHTVGDVIHLVNFVGPAVIEEGRTTNYPSEAAGEKFLNGVVSRRDTTTVDGIFRGATSGAMYTIAVTNGVATTKRIALRDEFKRLEANNPTRTVIRAGDDLNTAGYLQLDATGRWGMWNQQTASWQPLAIEQGGTGATTLADAQNLFKVPIAAGVKDFLTLPRTAGMEDGKYYPIIVRTDPYYAPATGTDITIVTRSSSGNDPMNCATLQCHYRTGGWTDRGDSFYGVVNFYQNEKAILGMVAPTRGKQEHVAFYVEARAFPVSIYASRNVVEVFTREQDYQVGSVTNNQDGVKFVSPLQSADLNLAVLGDNNTNTRPIVDFKGTSGFYTGGGTQWHYIGTAERYAVMSKMNMPKVELWADGIDYLCYSSPRKALFSNAGFQCASDGTEDLTNGTFTSKCGNGAGLKGQAEFRSTPEAGQVIVRDVVGTAHRFYNFNKDGTFSAPGGFVCHTGADWNNQFGNNNPSKILAGNVNGPEGSMVVGGLSVAFSGNYAFQMAGRLDQLYTRSIEQGNHRAWNKVIQHRGQGLGTSDLNDYKADREGIYHQEANANATAERHYPPGQQMAGTLIVLRNSANEGTGCVQIYKMYLGGTWERYYNNTGSGMNWSPWKRTSFPESTTAPVMPDLWLPLTSNLKPVLGEGEMIFSRPSTATYFTKRGVMAVAQANQPRFERDGLLIEGQRTNLMLNSEDPSKWGASQQITVGSTVTNTNGTKGARFTVNTISGVETTALNLATVPATRGADVTGAEKFCTGSIIARGGKAHQRLRVRFDMYNGSTTVFQGDAYVNLSTLEVKTTGGAAGRIKVKAERWQTAGPAWIRVVATFEAVDSDMNIGCQFQIAPPDGSQHAVGDWVDVAIPQFELGSCESSFIPTGSSPVTRAADLCKFPMTDNLAPRPFTIAATVDANWRGWGKAPNAAPRVIDTEGHQSGAAFIMGFSSAANIAEDGYPYCDIGGSNRRVYEMAKTRKLKIGFRIKDDGKTCSFANGLVSTETQSSWEFLAGGALIRLGGQTATGERHLFGHIKDVRVWNSALTDTQLMMESVE
ncbi:tail fiber protein [Escherichia phage S127 BCL3]|nr:tail fiber protein [Escherichia phage S127 BCL3]